MSEQDHSGQFYPSPNKLPSLRDLQSRQKQFNKLSAQRLSISKQPELQQQEPQIPPTQPPPTQLSGKKYYQSRYIHSPGQALSYQRSGQKMQDKSQYEQEQSVQQTPISQFSAHTRNKSDFQMGQQNWEMDPTLVDDGQIEQFVEQLLLDDMVAQQLRESKNLNTPFKVGKNVKELVLRLANQIMMNQGSNKQQSIAFQNQYNSLKQEYLKLQSDFSKRVSEQHDRIQRLENECKEKDELLIREAKTRQMLEQQNNQHTMRLSEVTGDYHSKLQMKEDIFYQKGQECYNEINVLRQLVGELQEKVQDKDVELTKIEDELERANERLKNLAIEREMERKGLQNEVYQWRARVEQMEADEKELAILVEQLKGELVIMESQCMERENHIRVCEEEKKRDAEAYELMMKEKDQQRVFEVNNLIQLAAIDKNKHSELRDKYLMKIELIEDEIKKFLLFKQEVVQWLFQQKTQLLGQVKLIVMKSTDTITKNAIWYRKLLKDRDIEYNQLVMAQVKEVNDLNERWQEMIASQEIQLKNEARSELLQETGKLETRIVELVSQISDFQTNYMRIKEHKESLQLAEAHYIEDNDKNLKIIGELDTSLQDCEWKLQKEADENKALAEELLSVQKKWQETEKKYNDCERRRILLEGKLSKETAKGEKLGADVKELLEEIEAEKSKFQQNEEVKRKSQGDGLQQIYDIIGLKEEIVQRQFEITKFQNYTVKTQVLQEDRQKEKEELLNKIQQQKEIVQQRNARIREMELVSRDDLKNYFLTNELQRELMNGLKEGKELLQKHINEMDKAHQEQTNQDQRDKVQVIEELHGIIAQLNQRNNELRHEKRTVEGLLATKKKLETIIDNLTKKIEELNDKISETEQKLKVSEESKEILGHKFDDYKLQQLKRKKFEIVSTKRLLAAFKAEYLDHKNTLENIVNQANSDLQTLTVSVDSSLNQLAVQYEQQLNALRMNLGVSHSDDINQLLYQEKERSRVQLDTVKKQMGEQIVQLGEQIITLKKKLSHTGGDKQVLGQTLDTSEMVKRFSTQQLQDIQGRYLNLKSELDQILSESKGKYQAIQQLHEQTIYTKEQITQLKQFTDIQDVLSSIIFQLGELLKKYFEIDSQRDRDLKASQSLMQSKILTTTKQVQEQIQQQKQQLEQEIPYQLTDSFSPTQYSQRRQYEQQQILSQQSFPQIQDPSKNESILKIQKMEE